MHENIIHLAGLEATRALAQQLAGLVTAPQLIALKGTLGAGKTQWARFFCQAVGVSPELVTSPTYVLVQRYRGTRYELYHLDFYRLQNEQQVWDLGFDELQEIPAVILVEWADKYPQTLPADRLEIQLLANSDGSRDAILTATGTRSQSLLTQVI
jgi:tRNA threonylcarbamoyladenosine biosynthesis protein TsaE